MFTNTEWPYLVQELGFKVCLRLSNKYPYWVLDQLESVFHDYFLGNSELDDAISDIFVNVSSA